MDELQRSTNASDPPLRAGPPRARKVSPGSGRRDSQGATREATQTPQSASASLQSPDVVESTQKPKRRLRFEEKYDRITLYLEKQVHMALRDRYDSGEVENLSGFFNAAVKDYLAKHFGA